MYRLYGSLMKVDALQLAEVFGIDRRTVTNWIKQKPPCPSEMVGRSRVFDSEKAIAWYMDGAIRRALAGRKPLALDFEEARTRKTLAEAVLAEIELATQKGELIPLAEYERELGAICERMRSVLTAVLSKYAGKWQIARSTMEAVGVMGDLQNEMLTALQRVGSADHAEMEAAEA
jgi:phage terminase Nu1 subunit (DNA packaging protein)